MSSVYDDASDNGILKVLTTSETESAEGSTLVSNKISSTTSAESQVSKSLHCQQNMPFCAKTKEKTIEKSVPTISTKKPSCLKTEIVQKSLPMMSIDPPPSTTASTNSAADTKNKLDTKTTKRVAYLQVEIKMRPSRRVIHIPP